MLSRIKQKQVQDSKVETRYKYPRTPHLPWSPGATSDDKRLTDVDHFIGKEVVVTEKMDGENTTIYPDYIHARSIDSVSHESQTLVRKLQGEIGHLIPSGSRICGENLYAKHSIHYQKLSARFQVFSLWEEETCLSWDDTSILVHELGLVTVPVLYRGLFSEEVLKYCYQENREPLDEQEGYVVRLAGEFKYADFGLSVAKFVRAGHVQTDEHWKSQRLVQNQRRS